MKLLNKKKALTYRTRDIELLTRHTDDDNWEELSCNTLEKQAKNRKKTGSNLSLGTRLARVKRVSRKRCCDTTPDRCQEGSRLTILFRIS